MTPPTLSTRPTRERRGATLPEVAIMAASFSILLAGLVTMGISAGSEWSRGSSRIMADNDASMAVQRIAQEMRDGASGTVSTDKLRVTVQMPYKDTTTGFYDRFRSGDTVTYYRDTTGNLYKQVNQNTPLLIGRNLRELSFDGGGEQVTIRLQTWSKTGTKESRTEYSTQVTFRNQPA